MYFCVRFLYMQLKRSFFVIFSLVCMVFYCAAFGCFVSCSGKQSANQDWVDSVLEDCDSIPEDTLVYEIEETPISKGVDENFIDFFYTFTHNRQFQLERLQLPLAVKDTDGEVLRNIRKLSDFDKEFTPSSKEYYVLLLSDISELEQDFSSKAKSVEVDVINLASNEYRFFDCVRKDEGWTVTAVSELPLASHPYGSFWRFYHQFVQDSVYQVAHINQPLAISLPDEDNDGELIEGNIDADQFSVFAPEMPNGHVLMIHYNGIEKDAKHVVMVKCGVSSSMMDIMTFECEEGEWKLVKLEE